MVNLLNSLSLGGEVEMLRGEEPMSKVNLGLRRELQINMFLMLLRLTVRGVVVPTYMNLLSQIVGKTFCEV